MKKIFEKPERIFLFICLFWSMLFLVVNPPFQGCDEDSHMFKMYGITQGSWNFKKYTTNQFTGENLTFGGQILPSGLVEAGRHNKRITFHSKLKTSLSETAEIAKIKLKKENPIFIGYPNPAYTPLSYFPSVIAVWLLSLINAAPLVMMYVSRICSLLTYLFLTYFAIKITPVKKWLFLALGTLPMALYSASTVSTDGLINGLAFLFTAFVLYLAYAPEKKQISKKDILFFNLASILIVISKFTYFPLIFLFLLIPKEKFTTSKAKMFGLTLGLNLVITVSYILYNMSLTKGVQLYSTSISPADTLKTILFHPINYLAVVFKTVIFNAKDYINNFVGIFGWLDTWLPYHVSNFYVLLLLLAAGINYQEPKTEISTKEKGLLAGIFILSFLMIITACSLIFMPDETTKTILGVQGRYLIPLAPMFFLLFQNNKFEFKTNIFKYFLLFGINFVLFISLVKIIYRFYL